MCLRSLSVLGLVSASLLMPAPSKGQVVYHPTTVGTYVVGNDLVVRWARESGVDGYVGQVDDDPRFRSPLTWTVREDGRPVYEARLPGLHPATYYVRLRTFDTFWLIRRDSDWTPVRVVRFFPSTHRPAPGPVVVAPWGGITSPISYGVPRSFEVHAANDDLLTFWSPVSDATAYVVQLDRDAGFRSPYIFTVPWVATGAVQQFTIRHVPPGRWYARVRAVPRSGKSAWAWSRANVVDVSAKRSIARRPVGLAEDRQEEFSAGRRELQGSAGKAKGQSKHVLKLAKRDRQDDDD